MCTAKVKVAPCTDVPDHVYTDQIDFHFLVMVPFSSPSEEFYNGPYQTSDPTILQACIDNGHTHALAETAMDRLWGLRATADWLQP